ncbi:unnamed protein product [Rotaria sordida]|uniref:HAT C-terminal dimerisation domain-containing protein n=1 Tax=Rotaria sordida TaxID=392033 RepID=A0A814YY68_9BILA|nr:unnamed protein product [Rotaria sordida]CAF1518483.1 unnamed protein product [Rotaria sordida]
MQRLLPRKQLLKKYKLYFEVKVTEEQSPLALVAAFLCLYAKQYLTVSDLKKAETIRIQEYNEILRSEKLISSATTNNIAVSSSNAQQSMESSEGHMEKSIDYLLKICLVEKPPVHKTTNKRIVWTIQQELGYYAMTGTPKRNFQSYWNLNQDKMPILASLVRRFCLSPATSVASESSFSCDNYIQRKQRSSLSSTNLCYTMVLRDAGVVRRLSQIY